MKQKTDIKDYARFLGLELVVKFFGQATDPHWHASFDGNVAQFLLHDGHAHSTMGGRARDPIGAIKQFCKNASGQKLHLNFGEWVESKCKAEPIVREVPDLCYNDV